MFNWVTSLVSRAQSRDRSASHERVSQLINEAFAYLQEGNRDRAGDLLAEVLRLRPEHADALYLSSVLARDEGRNQVAMDMVSKAIEQDSSIAAFHHTRATLLHVLGRETEAIDSYREAVRLDPEDAQLQSDLGCALVAFGNNEGAEPCLRNAVRLAPTRAVMQYNLGVALQGLRRFDDAIECYRKAWEMDPAHAEAGINLGSALHAQSRIPEAIVCFREVVKRHPERAQAWSNLACVLQINLALDEAETCARRAIALDDRSFDAYSNFALILREQGRLDESLDASNKALAIRDSLPERIRIAMLIPVVARTRDEIELWRERFRTEITRLINVGGRLADPLRGTGTCTFNLAFQPECDRSLQELTASLYLKVCPELQFVAPHCRTPRRPANRRIRVGFISRFFHDFIGIGRTSRGLMAHLDRSEFEVVALFVPPVSDDFTSRFVRDHADSHVILPYNLDDARGKIAELELDILFYQDIGMEQFTYFLAFSRLAPVQCVSFGFPDTTGIPNMDYWISSENFEREGAADDYSEQLVLLKGIGTLAYYYRPLLTEPKMAREHFGLPQDKHLYICPQSLFKAHPDFDAVFAGILRGDPDAEIVLVAGAASAWDKVLTERYREAMPDVYARIRSVPRMNQDVFLKLIAVCDVMLDPFYFSGMNSSLEGFAVGIPIVTMPTSQQRSRHTYGMYRHMGIHECIAESPKQYVEIALKLGQDREFHDSVRARILLRCPTLYEDMHVVREFERVFRELHGRVSNDNISRAEMKITQ